MTKNDASDGPTLILGAGLTGLSCAYHLSDPGRFRLIEREDQVGGLAKTRQPQKGFFCDGTGHWLHLRQDYTKTLVSSLLQGNLEPRQRRARVYSRGTFTLYPFQANTYGLPKEVIAQCVSGFIKARYEEDLPEPANFRDWIRREFGEGICEHFMVPYNEKIYGVPLETLAADFAEKYIPRPSLDAVINGAIGLSREALGYNAEFVYPKRGGIGALAESLHSAMGERAELNREPKKIDLDEGVAHMKDGELIRFQNLVSTIPLPELVNLLAAGSAETVPTRVAEAARQLRANSVLYFDVAIVGAPREHQDYHWIYVPEADIPFYRVGSYSAVESSLAPPGHRSYYVELGHYGKVDPAKFEQPVIDGLRKVGIVDDESEIVFMNPNVLEPAYVLFDGNYEASRSTVLDWLNQVGVITVGRYGRWQYNAMEDALLEGKEAAERIDRGQ